jgi:hypothetical protein
MDALFQKRLADSPSVVISGLDSNSDSVAQVLSKKWINKSISITCVDNRKEIRRLRFYQALACKIKLVVEQALACRIKLVISSFKSFLGRRTFHFSLISRFYSSSMTRNPINLPVVLSVPEFEFHYITSQSLIC